MYPTQFDDSFKLADLFLGAANHPTFVSFIEADLSGRDVLCALTNWAGGVNETSRAPMFGPWKAYSLLARGAKIGVTTTPIYEFKEGCQLPGGVREDSFITSCSAWENPKIDLMLALLLQWSLKNEVRFHHVGYRFINDEEGENALKAAMDKQSNTARLLHASDHDRYLVEVPTSKSQNKRYWKEFQKWSTPQKSNGLHWDFATTDPERMIEYIGKYSGLQVETWKREKGSPSALVHAFDKDGRDIAIHARSEWTFI
ncbi:MAG: hypothetical protein UR96_C0018G0005 [candidate division WS6 bacterium GW2011_GWC1_36_11]|uniref:Uncharacterized protein n=3 Tax=Candidatus Dojkabacteria TaxID=74243 RepID=A0A0G0DDB5_9BACT|nr:MAG: hypothetical protein UR96_C0018G0005 [candidate division WS6 bacterium GW2011_GWC1_36_11]KKQ11341.1 MAG: hypothetical protein US24_C0032G0005 [candidate division WS6 bacterium GW2011_GWC2_36_7]KKQ14916.1 MAG: hypothetical protein US29_C0056G0002 [candidate division WS6 bacterium GW2011_GWF1_36_8]HAM37281.1 hypothetical protein [Patescibacteria group bacterium]HAM96359.1 hypothetical protein [Patescibacteria group bacterium]